jgi:SAM-dependent methyltransferase
MDKVFSVCSGDICFRSKRVRTSNNVASAKLLPMKPSLRSLDSQSFEPVRRGRYQGVANIVLFNWPMYAGGLIISGVAAYLARLNLPRHWRVGAKIAAGLSFGYLANSLLASHCIYDRSWLYQWRWLRALLPQAPNRIVNVHAGFDESSVALQRLFPKAELKVLDFFDPTHHTEPSIERARRYRPAAIPAQRIDAASWGTEPNSADLILLFLAAHEIRRQDERVAFLRQASQTLAPGGSVVVVEHLRDRPNFMAFGPGFLHFHSRRTWLDSFTDAGLVVKRTFRITLFIHVFQLVRSDSVIHRS